MKKLLLSVFSVLALSVAVQAQTWNFSTLVTLPDIETPKIDYSTSTTIEGLTINAATGKLITIDKGNGSIDGYEFTQRLKFGGTGNITSRNVSFDVTGACSITIYGGSSSGSEERTLIVANASGTEIGSMTTQPINKLTVDYTGEAGTLYVFSKSSGFNIFLIDVKYGGSSINDVTADKGAVVATEYYNVTGVKVTEDTVGLILKKLTYENGTTEVVKTIVRK